MMDADAMLADAVRAVSGRVQAAMDEVLHDEFRWVFSDAMIRDLHWDDGRLVFMETVGLNGPSSLAQYETAIDVTQMVYELGERMADESDEEATSVIAEIRRLADVFSDAREEAMGGGSDR